LAAEKFSVPWFYSLIKSRLINLSYCVDQWLPQKYWQLRQAHLLTGPSALLSSQLCFVPFTKCDIDGLSYFLGSVSWAMFAQEIAYGVHIVAAAGTYTT
jgi:hypothetical protein